MYVYDITFACLYSNGRRTLYLSQNLWPKAKDIHPGREGEEYMLGSEVGNFLRLFRGDLYKKYPGLWKRKTTQEERRLASAQIGYGYATISSNVHIVKALEVEDIIAGNDEKYRASLGFDTVTHASVEASRPPSCRLHW